MKIINIIKTLSLALGLFLVSSCSKDGSADSAERDINLKLKLQYGSTRALDTEASDMSSKINTAHLVLLKKGMSVFVRELNEADLINLKSQDGYTVSMVSKEIDGAFMLINKPENVSLRMNMTVDELKKVSIETHILKIQPGLAPNYDNVKNGVMNGVATSFVPTGKVNPSTGNQINQAKIDVSPAVARLEVIGEILADENLVKNLKLNRLYLDNFITDNKVVAGNIKKVQVGVDVDLDRHFVGLESMFGNGGSDFIKPATGKVYAFHLFPQEVGILEDGQDLKDVTVKLLLKVVYDQYDSKGTLVKANRVEYPTLRFATRSEDSKELNTSALAIKAGSLYQVNLGFIDWNGDGVIDEDDKFKPGQGGDTPNAKSKDVGIEIEVTDWEEVVINPPL